jgi:hypothetical protein
MTIQFNKIQGLFSFGFSIMWMEGGHWHIIFDIGLWYIELTFNKTKDVEE